LELLRRRAALPGRGWREEVEGSHNRHSARYDKDNRPHERHTLREQICSRRGRLLAQQAIGGLAAFIWLRDLRSVTGGRSRGWTGQPREMDVGLDRGTLQQKTCQQQRNEGSCRCSGCCEFHLLPPPIFLGARYIISSSGQPGRRPDDRDGS
jgi:hypothetical protein